MKRYTVGFIFDPAIVRVALIHKNRPEWQKGRLNGVGGKIEEGETSIACIVREAREETGLSTKEDQWVFLGTIHESDVIVDFYAMLHAGTPEEVRTCTDELVEWYDALHLPEEALSNILWLVAYARDRLLHSTTHTFLVQYK